MVDFRFNAVTAESELETVVFAAKTFLSKTSPTAWFLQIVLKGYIIWRKDSAEHTGLLKMKEPP